MFTGVPCTSNAITPHLPSIHWRADPANAPRRAVQFTDTYCCASCEPFLVTEPQFWRLVFCNWLAAVRLLEAEAQLIALHVRKSHAANAWVVTVISLIVTFATRRLPFRNG